jgi:hypothetical protein
MTIQNKTLRLIQSRLRNRDHKISYQEIRSAIALLHLTEDDLLTDENIVKVVDHFTAVTEAGLAVLPNLASPTSLLVEPDASDADKYMVSNELVANEEEEEEEVDMVSNELVANEEEEVDIFYTEPVAEPEPVTGKIQLTGQSKLDFIEEAAGKAGFHLDKTEIAEIAETAPSSFQSRRQAIASVLSCIRQYLDDEADFIASEFGKIGDKVTDSDRTVVAKVNSVLGGVSNSASNFKSLADKLKQSFSGINGKNI